MSTRSDNRATKASGNKKRLYGIDRLNVALLLLAAALGLLAYYVAPWIGAFALLPLVSALIRMLSTDRAARTLENQQFVRIVAGPDAWLRLSWAMLHNRKTKAYVPCPHCGTYFALPKGKGCVRATCPYCGQQSIHTV